MYSVKQTGIYESKSGRHGTSSVSSITRPPPPTSQHHAAARLHTAMPTDDPDDDDDVADDDTSYHNFRISAGHLPDLTAPESNAIHYQITHDDPHFKRLSLHPLHSQFEEFAKLRPSTGNSNNKKPPQMGGDDGFEEDDLTKIALFGIEAWFTQGKIFSTPLCKVTLYDVRSMFWRVQKSALTFKEFENFIEDLAEFRQIHPDMIVFRLRLCGSPELEARLSHLTVPEGTVDRVVDAFRLNSVNVREEFVNLSKTPYSEPVCYGGVPFARRNKGLQSEQKMLKSKAIGLMTKGDPGEKLDPLMQNFIYFSKNGNYMSDGRTVELTQLIKWIKQAGIIDGDTITSLDIGFLFKRLYSLTWRIYFTDLHHFVRELAGWKRVSVKNLLQKLRNCVPPASSSITIISLTLPETLLGVLKAVLINYAEDYEENRDLYEPTSADGPFGHTPNSRNRHFKNGVEASVMKVHKVSTGSCEKEKKSSSEDSSQSQNNDSMLITTKRDNDVNDKEEAFSEETTRSGKNQLAKRWNDAYPFGQEGIHRGRVEAELEKLMFGPDRADDSSSDEDVRKLMFRRYDISAPHSGPTSHVAVPLEEQFEKFKKYGEHISDDGISLKNIQLWFTLAGMLVHGTSSLFTMHELEVKFKQFAQDHNWLDYDKFLSLLEALAGGANRKKKTNIKEIKERLSRCGPPREPKYKTKISVEDRKILKGSKEWHGSKDEPDMALAATPKSSREEVDDFNINDDFKARYQEFARFGEPTVPEAYSIPGLSMLNANKWFRESKLLDLLNQGDVDVLYKQLYPNRQRISLQEFCKLTHAHLETIPERQDITFEFMLTALVECGPPQITEIPNPVVPVVSKTTNAHGAKPTGKLNAA